MLGTLSKNIFFDTPETATTVDISTFIEGENK